MNRNTLKPAALAVALLSTLSLGACNKDGADAGVAKAAPAEAAYSLDEAALPPVNRFQFADLDS